MFLKDTRVTLAVVITQTSDIVIVALSADSTLAILTGLVAVQVTTSAVEQSSAVLAVARQSIGIKRRRRTVTQQHPVLLVALNDAFPHRAARRRPDKGDAVVLAARNLAVEHSEVAALNADAGASAAAHLVRVRVRVRVRVQVLRRRLLLLTSVVSS